MIPVPQRRVWLREPRNLARLLDAACIATLSVAAIAFVTASVLVVRQAALVRELVGGL